MFEPVRGGTRGGQGEFKWTDVSADKDRENYLGHSINAPTGRWQKNKDIHWYNRQKGMDEEERLAEIRKVKELEKEALSTALGFEPAEPGSALAAGAVKGATSANAIPLGNNLKVGGAVEEGKTEEEKRKEKEARKREKAERKEEKARKKEEKRAKKKEREHGHGHREHRHRLHDDGRSDDRELDRRRRSSRSRSPRRTADRDHSRTSSSPQRNRRRRSRSRSPARSPHSLRREQDRPRDERREPPARNARANMDVDRERRERW
ncbi:hypothetical protein FA15DRAFT_674216 [Coprinopsis marcescibilis]|uniref:Multiple myeloma tumor-associated protein 2-like N-terminal domain-containing protein n=1 Tax=Coprinopsis marcescibilis TaxID=230819 RepID=A0A5C3KI55_COPMA|nr:hypothetical protein FA15DRAFT_674216 [Coprinopsis marcescibilis]